MFWTATLVGELLSDLTQSTKLLFSNKKRWKKNAKESSISAIRSTKYLFLLSGKLSYTFRQQLFAKRPDLFFFTAVYPHFLSLSLSSSWPKAFLIMSRFPLVSRLPASGLGSLNPQSVQLLSLTSGQNPNQERCYGSEKCEWPHAESEHGAHAGLRAARFKQLRKHGYTLETRAHLAEDKQQPGEKERVFYFPFSFLGVGSERVHLAAYYMWNP